MADLKVGDRVRTTLRHCRIGGQIIDMTGEAPHRLLKLQVLVRNCTCDISKVEAKHWELIHPRGIEQAYEIEVVPG